jgi:glucans biosynthesis protein C
MYQKERIYYLDWLRIFAFSILILFHSWQPFNNFQWLLKSEHTTMVADIFTVFFHTWRLYLVFFVSGVGTLFALRPSGKLFFYNRFMRLIVPYVFGVILIVPCQYYYQSLQAGVHSSFLDFIVNYPVFIASKNLQFDPFLWIMEIGIHLWYLASLFIITLVTFPFLKKINANGISEALMQQLIKRPKWLLLFSLPIVFTIMLLKPVFPEYTSVTDFLTYAFFFVYGFIFMKEHERLLPIIKRNNNILLVVGIVSSLLLIGCLLYEPLRNAAFNPAYNKYHLTVSLLLGLSAFSWTFYFVSLFSRRFNFNSKALPEFNRCVLPVYIVHQSIIVVAGFYIIKYVHNGLSEFVLILLAAIIGSALSYFFIKRFKLSQLLFGMKHSTVTKENSIFIKQAT